MEAAGSSTTLTHVLSSYMASHSKDSNLYITLRMSLAQRNIRAGFLPHVIADHAGPSVNTLAFS
jgi:hypothetical protein